MHNAMKSKLFQSFISMGKELGFGWPELLAFVKERKEREERERSIREREKRYWRRERQTDERGERLKKRKTEGWESKRGWDGGIGDEGKREGERKRAWIIFIDSGWKRKEYEKKEREHRSIRNYTPVLAGLPIPRLTQVVQRALPHLNVLLHITVYWERSWDWLLSGTFWEIGDLST